MDPPSPYHTSADTMPFKSTNYQLSDNIEWFLMKSPAMTDTEVTFIDGLNSVNNIMFDATGVPFIA